MKKNRGFTLIELLAVIVILAIIALIAVPVIMNIINKANESAFKDSAYGVISAGELYFAERQLEPNGMLEDITITLPETTKILQLKGEVPTGSILITKEGKIAIAVHNNRYCVTKGLEDENVEIIEDYESCDLPVSDEESDGNISNSLLSSENDCIKAGNTCSIDEIKAGIKVNVKVNDADNYDFYVISDDGEELTLIMNKNLGDRVGFSSWYNSAPNIAIEALKTRTETWTNIPEREYTYSDADYSSVTETMRVRIITKTEAENFYVAEGNWLNENLSLENTVEKHAGYWTTSMNYMVIAPGTFTITDFNGPNYSKAFGVRPVITLSK